MWPLIFALVIGCASTTTTTDKPVTAATPPVLETWTYVLIVLMCMAASSMITCVVLFFVFLEWKKCVSRQEEQGDAPPATQEITQTPIVPPVLVSLGFFENIF